MDLEMECPCGDEMEVRGELMGIETEADLRTECPNCGRGYMLTLTRYRKPTAD